MYRLVLHTPEVFVSLLNSTRKRGIWPRPREIMLGPPWIRLNGTTIRLRAYRTKGEAGSVTNVAGDTGWTWMLRTATTERSSANVLGLEIGHDLRFLEHSSRPSALGPLVVNPVTAARRPSSGKHGL